MKISHLFYALIILTVISSCTAKKSNADNNESWISLFNGKDLDDWFVKIQHHDVGENFGSTFRVEDGVIKVRYDQYQDFNEQFGHLYYKVPFSKYHLVLEYRFTGELHKGAPDYTL